LNISEDVSDHEQEDSESEEEQQYTDEEFELVEQEIITDDLFFKLMILYEIKHHAYNVQYVSHTYLIILSEPTTT